MSPDSNIQPLRKLLADLSHELHLLGRQTIGLARAEVSVATSAIAVSLAWIAAGAVIALIGILVLASAVVLVAVAVGLPAWAAAVIVGLVLLGSGALVARVHLTRLRSAPLDLPETRVSVRETVQWLRSQATK